MWGPDYGDQVDYLRAFIKSLRKKIEPNPEHPQYITTEPWVGYRFNGAPRVFIDCASRLPSWCRISPTSVTVAYFTS